MKLISLWRRPKVFRSVHAAQPEPPQSKQSRIDFEAAPPRPANLMNAVPAQGAQPAPLKPIEQRRRELCKGMRLVGEPPLTSERLAAAAKVFISLSSDPTLGLEARTWYAICKRLTATDASHDFQQILANDPQNRLALINFAANLLTKSPRIWDLDDTICLATLARMHKYTTDHPEDIFARLVEALLLADSVSSKVGDAIELVEKIYLDDPTYSPAISVMAVLLAQESLNESAEGYAREAMAKDPLNFQAVGIARYLGIADGWLNHEGMEHAPASSGISSLEAILFASYFVQDPLAREDLVRDACCREC
jgi:hypothetical protein